MMYFVKHKTYPRSYFLFSVFSEANKKLYFGVVSTKDVDAELNKKKQHLAIGCIVPSLALGDVKILENADVYQVINKVVHGYIDFNASTEAVVFTSGLSKGNKFENLTLKNSYSIVSPGQLNFTTRNYSPNSDEETVYFSHVEGSRVFVYFNSGLKGFQFLPRNNFNFCYPFVKINVLTEDTHTLFELGKMHFKLEEYQSAIVCFDLTISAYEHFDNKTHLVANALRNKARSHLKLHQFLRAQESLLDTRCALLTSWDFYYRSVATNDFLNKKKFSEDEIALRKLDMQIFRNRLITEIQAKSANFSIYNITNQNSFEFKAFQAFFSTYLFETIYICNQIENQYSFDLDYTIDLLLDLEQLRSSDSFNLFATEKFLSLTKPLNSKIYFSEQVWSALRQKAVPDYCVRNYWILRTLTALIGQKTNSQINEILISHGLIPDRYIGNEFHYILKEFEWLKKNLKDENDEWVFEDFIDPDYFYPLFENNPLHLFDLCYRKAIIHFDQLQFQECINELDEQLNFFDVDFNNSEEYDQLSYGIKGQVLDGWGFFKIFEIYFMMAKCEFELKNYTNAFDQIKCAFNIKRNLSRYHYVEADKNILNDAKKLEREIILKIGSRPIKDA